MHKTHRLSRLASLGLVAVLLILTVYAIYTTVITLAVISQANKSVYISDLYQQDPVPDHSLHLHRLCDELPAARALLESAFVSTQAGPGRPLPTRPTRTCRFDR